MASERSLNTLPPEFGARLLAWYDGAKRDLPWRETRDAYPVWISEIMLQQTRVAAVIPYYNRFMAQWPDIHALANASEADVLSTWSGLGYYRRARLMLSAAQTVRESGGIFPSTASELRALPGIGRYTAAAIASIAFGEPIGVVDGNVERVLTRISGKPMDNAACWAVIDQLVDHSRPGDWNQALMELGASICTPNAPKCVLCPVVDLCGTRGKHAAQAPARRKRAAAHHLLRMRGQRILLQKRPAKASLMAGMWELPALNSASGEALVKLRHSITDTDYAVEVFAKGSPIRRGSQRWTSITSLSNIPITGLTKKILRKLHILES